MPASFEKWPTTHLHIHEHPLADRPCLVRDAIFRLRNKKDPITITSLAFKTTIYAGHCVADLTLSAEGSATALARAFAIANRSEGHWLDSRVPAPKPTGRAAEFGHALSCWRVQLDLAMLDRDDIVLDVAEHVSKERFPELHSAGTRRRLASTFSAIGATIKMDGKFPWFEMSAKIWCPGRAAAMELCRDLKTLRGDGARITATVVPPLLSSCA